MTQYNSYGNKNIYEKIINPKLDNKLVPIMVNKNLKFIKIFTSINF